MKINWALVPDAETFEPVPIAKYPAVLKVDNIKRDTQGNPMTNGDGKPTIRTTNAGDEMWHIEATILDGKQVGRVIFDQISFGGLPTEGALKRARIILVRAGIIDGDKEYDAQPEELDGSYWWIDVDRHEARMQKGPSGKYDTPKTTKGGKPVLDPRIAFAGYELMTPQDAKRYRESYAAYLARKADASVPSGDGTTGEANHDEVPF